MAAKLQISLFMFWLDLYQLKEWHLHAVFKKVGAGSAKLSYVPLAL